MSERRKVDIGEELDFIILEEVARAKGYSVRKNSKVAGYTAGYTVDSSCDLVLSNSDTYDIGFRQEGEKTACVYDSHRDTASKKLYDVMASYKERLITRRAPLAGFRIVGRKEVGNEIVLTVRKG